MPDRQPFPGRLRELLDGAGYSVSAAAKLLGVSRATVYNLLNGTHRPDWPLVQRIADLFHVTTDSLRDD